MKLQCFNCDGTGIGAGMRASFGELMNLCDRCDGHGVITDEPGEKAFVAIFAVSARYVVHMHIPRRKGGDVPMQIHWSPRLPRARGRSRLTYTEREAYTRGRNAAVAALMHQLGGGGYTVVAAQAAA